jgi:hypothetical protein
MLTFVAISSDGSLSWRRAEIGASSMSSPFSTAISAVATQGNGPRSSRVPGGARYFRPLATTGQHAYGRGVWIRAELIVRTEADLERVRGELARLSGDDSARRALIEREAEFNHLLDDLEHSVLSPVEAEAELATLRELRVPLAQGYLVGRPAPVAEWAEQLDAVSATTARDDVAVERDTIPGARDAHAPDPGTSRGDAGRFERCRPDPLAGGSR